MAAPAGRRKLGRSPWHCYSDFVHCEQEHLLTDYKSGFRVNRRQLNGPALFVCTECNPRTYFLAVFTSRPTPMATCYALSQESHAYWDAEEEYPEIPELLHRMTDPDGNSHNPFWRPPRPREKR